MSLLIKALHQAEQKKASEDKLTASADGAALTLEPRDGGLEAEAGLAAAAAMHAPAQTDPRPPAQRAASVIFAAKRRGEHTSTYILIAAGVLLLMIVAGVFYYYLESLRTPEVIVPAQPIPPALVTATPATLPAAGADESDAEREVVPAAPAVEDEPPAQDISAKDVTVQDENLLDRVIELEQKVAQEPASLAAPAASPAPVAAGSKVQVTRSIPPPAVDPRLQAAYRAFVAGDDATAQAAYRQVLQTDVRNTDALLGMAAVALRQGRDEDAAGWYNAVLEVDPRNSFAQAALANLFGGLDPVSAESRIKNLIARQPEAAHLHAALGNLYAGQQQWPQAQQAYFEAYRLAADNADYAFNLAVSLDQMGKPGLALQYYEQALSLLGSNATAVIDRAVLEARIRQLQ